MKPHRIASETALKMTPTEMLDVIFDAPEYSIIELSVINPDPGTGNNRGIYLEILKLDDFESVIRDREPINDGDRYIASTDDIYSIYRALVESVDEVT